MSGAPPCVDGIKIKVAGVGVSLGEASREQVGQYLIELLEIDAETASGR